MTEPSRRYVVAIDGGTTNTRASVVDLESLAVRATARRAAGARNTGAQGRESLEAATAEAVSSALEQAGVVEEEVAEVVASGMITSEAGLLDVPHVVAPAGVREVAQGTVRRLFPPIWPAPITFVPGVKVLEVPYQSGRPVPVERIMTQDIMRGEESETLGLLHLLKLRGPAIFVLPGSHTKLLLVDEENRITTSVTTIAGELASAVASATLLARSLESGNLGTVDEEAALAGFEAARRHGLGRSLFSLRLLHLLAATNVDQRKSYLWGALVAGDVAALEADPRLGPLARGEHGEVALLIGGSDPLRSFFGLIFRQWAASRPALHVNVLAPEVVAQASAVGATLVALEARRADRG
ncbi:MAG: 2-dehydro-3-deoxygalactonokinase [Bacillota bacterium]|nr:2-dehydro-3-deoxygalactonokinase [Bacillota bacterium]